MANPLKTYRAGNLGKFSARVDRLTHDPTWVDVNLQVFVNPCSCLDEGIRTSGSSSFVLTRSGRIILGQEPKENCWHLPFVNRCAVGLIQSMGPFLYTVFCDLAREMKLDKIFISSPDYEVDGGELYQRSRVRVERYLLQFAVGGKIPRPDRFSQSLARRLGRLYDQRYDEMHIFLKEQAEQTTEVGF